MSFAKFNPCNPCCTKKDDHIFPPGCCIPDVLPMCYRADIAIAPSTKFCLDGNDDPTLCREATIVNYPRCTSSRILFGGGSTTTGFGGGCGANWDEWYNGTWASYLPMELLCQGTYGCAFPQGFSIYGSNAASMYIATNAQDTSPGGVGKGVPCSEWKLFFAIGFSQYAFGNISYGRVYYEANIGGWTGGALTLHWPDEFEYLRQQEGQCGIYPKTMTITPIPCPPPFPQEP
jgi:hypothetical protein